MERISRWAAGHLCALVLEQEGLEAAQGPSLVHFDLYPHNILLTPDRVLFVDWPHARLGAPFLDLLMFLSSAAAAGIDPEPITAAHEVITAVAPRVIDAVLAAHSGFLLAGSLEPAPPGLQPIVAAKTAIGLGALRWLERRLEGRPAGRNGW